MSFFENTRKPVGLGGKLMVNMMNIGHHALAEWGMSFFNPEPDAKILDCGCGGGANIKAMLKKCPRGIVKGVDYSSVSVEKARKLNKRRDKRRTMRNTQRKRRKAATRGRIF